MNKKTNTLGRTLEKAGLIVSFIAISTVFFYDFTGDVMTQIRLSTMALVLYVSTMTLVILNQIKKVSK